jgi:putative SOS response-associated peptidase YedK
MCGRYSLATDLDALDDRFAFRGGLPSPLPPRFNIAPTDDVVAVTREGSENRAELMRWGLIPSWAKEPKSGRPMINARAESVVEKASFRDAFQQRRCLVLADGFYEWRKAPGRKVPMRFVMRSGEPFAFAGLWERWKAPEGTWVHSCAIITTSPNALMEPVHDRMPVILTREAEGQWLDVGGSNQGDLRELLVPYAAHEMEAFEVSPLVNSVKNDTPDVIAREGGRQPLL